ncbi:MAG: M48 family metallopeptidase [Granulosicoccus sp.]|nr:M48 family metallopeptidase [Granulosicoccus sp.]
MQLGFDFSDEIEYQLVESARIRRASLRVEPGIGLIVTVPRRFPELKVTQLIESNRQWITDCLAAIERDTPEHYRMWPPRFLDLLATGEHIHLSYEHADRVFNDSLPGMPPMALNVPVSNWSLLATPSDKQAVASELAARLKRKARGLLVPRVTALAHLHRLSFKRVVVRGQKTVWGSYSSSGTLSLNYKLLFLRPRLLDYVLLHELAHSVVLDHSPKFWSLLCQLDVDAHSLDKELKTAGNLVPPWLELAS